MTVIVVVVVVYIVVVGTHQLLDVYTGGGIIITYT